MVCARTDSKGLTPSRHVKADSKGVTRQRQVASGECRVEEGEKTELTCEGGSFASRRSLPDVSHGAGRTRIVIGCSVPSKRWLTQRAGRIREQTMQNYSANLSSCQVILYAVYCSNQLGQARVEVQERKEGAGKGRMFRPWLAHVCGQNDGRHRRHSASVTK